MAKYSIVMDGVEQGVVNTLKELAEALGVSRVSNKDLQEGKYPEVVLLDEANLDTEPNPITTMEQADEALEEVGIDATEDAQVTLQDIADASDNIEIIMVGDAPTMDDVDDSEDWDKVAEEVGGMPEDTNELTNREVDTNELTNEEGNLPDDADDIEESIEFPEVGEFKTEKDMKKYIKKLSDDELQEWCELEGATWKPNDHQSINRMRMAMAIKAIHFPDTAPKASKKKKSKYADYTTEDLVQMALDNDIPIKDAKGDPRIERMYTIMALREAGLLA